MAVNNGQVSKLLDAAIKTQASVDRQVSWNGKILHQMIIERFDSLTKVLRKTISSGRGSLRSTRKYSNVIRPCQRLQ